MTDTNDVQIRTSQSHPLEISDVEIPGLAALGITFCPGKHKDSLSGGRWERDLEIDAAAIREWAPTDVVFMLTAEERDALAPLKWEGNFRTSWLGRFQGYVPGIKVYQGCACHWPCPKSDSFRDIHSVPALLTQPGARVLIIGRNGQERSATLAVEMILRDGIMDDLQAAIDVVEAARPQSVRTQKQIDYLKSHWERRLVPGAQVPWSQPKPTDQLLSARSSPLELTNLMAYADSFLHLQSSHQSEGAWREMLLAAHILPGGHPGFSYEMAMAGLLAVFEGVKSLYGPGDPEFIKHLASAARVDAVLPAGFVPEGGYGSVEDIPEEALALLARDPGFFGLLILHEAGYGTPYGRACVKHAAGIFFDLDMVELINGNWAPAPGGADRFGFAAVVQLPRTLKRLFPDQI
ncbi:MAG: hypothetical protein ABJN42_00635 [Roseibium sp.]|uniref:hypothetical protein n=1 Tax=Roseibium sp. TaxID=1936156 RepID=UPI00329A383D